MTQPILAPPILAPLRRRALLALPLALPLAAATSPALAASRELVMFDRPGCPWCLRWDREVGAIYPRTAEGRAAPLRRVDLSAAGAESWLAAPVRFAPTFVLRDPRKERGRITGYAGDDAFWGLLGALLARGDS
jgi:hypothetical protein